MTKTSLGVLIAVPLVSLLALAGCGSNDCSATGSCSSSGGTGTGGAAASGGTSGAGGTSGSAGVGGSGAAGGGSGAGGSGGAAGGTAGTAGASGGSGGVGGSAAAEGQSYYNANCAFCHGQSGKGDGPGGVALSPKPQDFTSLSWQGSVTDTDIRKVIVKGGAALGKSPACPPHPDLQSNPSTLDQLLVIIRGFAGCSPESATIYAVGDTATATDYKLAVTQVVHACTPPYPSVSQPAAGNVWLGINVTVQSTTSKALFVNSGQATLTDATGTGYSTIYNSTTDCDPVISSGSTPLSNGQAATGWVRFEIPQTASGLRMTYNPPQFGCPQVVTFSLGL